MNDAQIKTWLEKKYNRELEKMLADYNIEPTSKKKSDMVTALMNDTSIRQDLIEMAGAEADEEVNKPGIIERATGGRTVKETIVDSAKWTLKTGLKLAFIGLIGYTAGKVGAKTVAVEDVEDTEEASDADM